MRHRFGRLLLLMAGCAAPAAAADYTLFVYETPAQLAARTDPARAPAYWGGYAAFGKAAADAGVMRGGSAVQPASAGAVTGSAKPAAAGMQLSGFFIVEAADLAAATRWAQRLPAAAVDIRPNIPMMAK